MGENRRMGRLGGHRAGNAIDAAQGFRVGENQFAYKLFLAHRSPRRSRRSEPRIPGAEYAPQHTGQPQLTPLPPEAALQELNGLMHVVGPRQLQLVSPLHSGGTETQCRCSPS